MWWSSGVSCTAAQTCRTDCSENGRNEAVKNDFRNHCRRGGYNDYFMAKRRKAFRRAALQLSAVALLQRQIVIAMSIARMIFKIIRCQTCRLATKSIESSIDFAMRLSLSAARRKNKSICAKSRRIRNKIRIRLLFYPVFPFHRTGRCYPPLRHHALFSQPLDRT